MQKSVAASRMGLSMLAMLIIVVLSWSIFGTVTGLPILGPDLWNCSLIDPQDGPPVDCCLPTDVPIVDFEFPDPSEPIKYRRNAATLDSETITKLSLAYQKMRALPKDDPRSMFVQQNIHCGYCTSAYTQLNSTKTLEIHRNWLLLPFHRMYIYFHERILGSLIGDPSLAIPFWNWDNQSSVHHPSPNMIPEFMALPGLYDPNRDPEHLAPKLADLHWGKFQDPADHLPRNATDEVTRLANNVLMHMSVVSGATLPSLFLGMDYRFDDDTPWGASQFEMLPHGSVHEWVGSCRNPRGEDMSPSYSAARDPIFYQHHSNVDRLLEVWRALGGRRTLPTDPDFLDAAFFFYNEKGEMVRVTIRQSLETEKLRYSFEPSEDSWLEDPSIALSTPESSTPGPKYWMAKAVSSAFSWLGSVSLSSAMMEFLADVPDMESVRSPRFSSSVFRARVNRPHAALRAAGALDHLEEVLVIDGIWIPSKAPVWFNIFINLPEADQATLLYATEWCGRYSNGPHLDRAGHMEREAVFSISIGEKLKKLGIVDKTSVVVNLVPVRRRMSELHPEVQLKAVRIELQ